MQLTPHIISLTRVISTHPMHAYHSSSTHTPLHNSYSSLTTSPTSYAIPSTCILHHVHTYLSHACTHSFLFMRMLTPCAILNSCMHILHILSLPNTYFSHVLPPCASFLTLSFSLDAHIPTPILPLPSPMCPLGLPRDLHPHILYIGWLALDIGRILAAASTLFFHSSLSHSLV
jgi:hypothetical protein